MQVTSQRASAILYNYLSGNHFDKPFLLPANVCPVAVSYTHLTLPTNREV